MIGSGNFGSVYNAKLGLDKKNCCSQGTQPGPVLGIMRPGAVQKKWGLLSFKKKNLWKITLHTVSATKLLIKLLYSIFSNKSCSIDNIVNPFNLSCDIVDRK